MDDAQAWEPTRRYKSIQPSFTARTLNRDVSEQAVHPMMREIPVPKRR